MSRAVVLFVLVIWARAALGCSITVTDTLKRTFQEADAVFIGRVVSVEMQSATFEVEEWLKGSSSDRFVLSTSSSCDFTNFRVGGFYLVFAEDQAYGEGRAEQFHASSGHTMEVTPETKARVDLVRERAPWWRSRASRFAPIRMMRLLWEELRYLLVG